MLPTRFLWLNMTPFGTPVVPELYGMTATSEGEEELGHPKNIISFVNDKRTPCNQVSTVLKQSFKRSYR